MKRTFFLLAFAILAALGYLVWTMPGPSLSSSILAIPIMDEIEVYLPTPEQIAALESARLEATGGFSENLEFTPHYEGEHGFKLHFEFADGRPASGATVWAQELSMNLQGKELAELMHAAVLSYVGESDWHLHAKRKAKAYQATEDGSIRLPAPEQELLVIAELDGHRAVWRDEAPHDPAELRLTLRPPNLIPVRVQQPSRLPAPDAPVALRLGPDFDLDAVRTRSDANGVAMVDVDVLALSLPADSRGMLRPHVVALAAPLAADDLSKMEVQAPLSGATLALPPSGAIDLLLPPGTPEGSLLECWVDREDSKRASAVGCEKRLVRAERTRLPYVGLGLRLRARLMSPTEEDLGEITFDGPTRAGETLLVDWVEAAGGQRPQQEFVAQLLDERNKPLEGHIVRVYARFRHAKPGLTSGRTPTALSLNRPADASLLLYSGPDGLLRFTLSDDRAVEAYDLRISTQMRSGSRVEVRRIAFAPTKEGVIDLGKLVAKEGKIWAKGRVVDPSGKPIADAEVHPGEWYRSFIRGEWRSIPASGPDLPDPVSTGFGGYFRVPMKSGFLVGEPYISVTAEGYVGESVTIELGQEDIEVVLQPESKLEVEILSDPEAPVDLGAGLSLTLCDPSRPFFVASHWSQEHGKNWSMDRLARGEYQLEVRDDLKQLLLEPIPVSLAPLPGSGAHKVLVDVRGLLQTVRVRAWKDESPLLAKELRVFSGDGGYARADKTQGEWIELRTLRGEVTALLEAEEGWWFRGKLTEGEQDVQLTAPRRLSIRVTSIPAEAAGLPLQLSLQAPGRGWSSAGGIKLPDEQGLYHFAVPGIPVLELVGNFSPVPRMLLLDKVRVEGVASVQLAEVDAIGIANVEIPPGPWLEAIEEALARTKHHR